MHIKFSFRNVFQSCFADFLNHIKYLLTFLAIRIDEYESLFACTSTYCSACAVAQWVRAFAPQAEVWVFESQPRKT